VHPGAEQGAVFQPLALAIAELVNGARLVEDYHRQLRYVLRVGAE
jgi:hypothetical protein